MKIGALADDYLLIRATSLIDKDGVVGFIKEAAREYGGWAKLKLIETDAEITADSEITESEWSVIKPLAYLFIEKESALLQEFSRMASHEPSGRSSSEVEQDIVNFRNEYFRQWAFSCPIVSI